MEITEAQFKQIEHCLPRQRGNVSLSNLQVLNAILYVAEHGCKWRGLPPRFGRWHTIYTRMNRWSRNGVLDRGLCQVQCRRLFSFVMRRSPVDYRAKPASLQRYQLAMRSFSRVR